MCPQSRAAAGTGCPSCEGRCLSVQSHLSRRFLLLVLCDFLRAASSASPVVPSSGAASAASEAALLRPCLLGIATDI